MKSPQEIDLLCGEIRRAMIACALAVLFGIACVNGAIVRYVIWPYANG